jgi:hypothetical protein
MNRPLMALALAGCLFGLAAPAQQRAYAPENLRPLSYNDQVRVISLEYEEQSGGRRIPDDQLRFYLDQVNRSNWGFSRIKTDISQSLTGSPRPPDPPQGGTVRCESLNNKAQTGYSTTCASVDNRRVTCAWPPSYGTPRLLEQLSRQPCIAGQTWGVQSPTAIWVSQGCRGRFGS